MTTDSNNPAAERLKLQNAVSSLLASGGTLLEVADDLLRLLTEFLGWDIAALWLSTRDGPLRAARIHEKDSRSAESLRAATGEAVLEKGAGLPGRAVEQKESVFVPDLARDELFVRSHDARLAGIVSGLAIPIIAGGHAIGALDFYSRSPRSIESELLATLGSIGRQLGQFIAKLRLEGALSDSEGGYRAVLESIAIGVVTIDTSSRIVATNPALESMFGYNRGELLGRQLTDLMPPHMRPLHEMGIRRYLETGRRHIAWDGTELPAIRKDGTEIIVSVTFGELRQAGSTFFTGSIHDITSRREAEREAASLRYRMDELIASIPGVVWEAWGDPDNPAQTISFVSEQVESILGYSRKEWLSTPNFWLGIVHPEDRDRAARTARETLEGKRTAPNEFRWITKDGRTIWVESHSVPVIRDGKPVGMRGVTLDVSERVRGEERIRILAAAGKILTESLEYEETLAQVADLFVPALADWCVIDLLDADGKLARLKVKHVDPEKVELAQRLEKEYPTDPDSPRGVVNVIRTGEPELISEISEGLVREAVRDEEHFRILQALGLRSYIVVPIATPGRILGAISLVTSTESGLRYDEEDLEFALELGRRAGQAIRNAELYQGAAAASRAKDEFLATLSHELRTPMTAILGWARLLLLEDLDPELQREAIGTIATSADAQAELIDDVLDVSRIVTGKLKLEIGPVDLRGITHDAVQGISPAAAARQITIRESVEEVPLATGDEGRIRQIVWNLLSNAVKFTPKGGRVEVRLRSDRSSIILEVEDDGIGIAHEFLPRVFERFQQAESSTSREHGGLGLGLAIVRHLTELHGGEVEVQSEGLGKGSTFRVVLPTAALHFEKDELPHDYTVDHQETERRLPRLRHCSILVVDDERDARRLVSTILQQCGATVATAESVDEALSRLRDQIPDLIVSDIGMPHRDGYELIRAVRNAPDEPLRSIAAIALTAYGRDEDRQRALDAGFDSYIRKPAHPVELADEVARLLDRPANQKKPV
ncbi:MAG: PAS domain S-box protein [Acidobacteria bacterium]|nr:PAS domain S-box protein [Acidobacteriota bacterium]